MQKKHLWFNFHIAGISRVSNVVFAKAMTSDPKPDRTDRTLTAPLVYYEANRKHEPS